MKAHGISIQGAAYYGEHLTGGGVLVTVNGSTNNTQVGEILRRNVGHSVNNPRVGNQT